MTLFLTKNLLETFLVSLYFASHSITVLLKILGGGCMGRPPPKILSPLSLRLSSVVPQEDVVTCRLMLSEEQVDG